MSADVDSGRCASPSSPSGTGSLLESILDSGVPVDLVVADRPCRAVDVAASHDVEAALVERASFVWRLRPGRLHRVGRRRTPGCRSDHRSRRHGGVRHTVFDKPIFDAYDGRIINTHPGAASRIQGVARGRRGHRRRREGSRVAPCMWRPSRFDSGADPGPGGRRRASGATTSRVCTNVSRS